MAVKGSPAIALHRMKLLLLVVKCVCWLGHSAVQRLEYVRLVSKRTQQSIDMTWYDMLYMLYDLWYAMIHYNMIYVMIWCHMLCYDICYIIWHGIWYVIIWYMLYMIRYAVIWYMIRYMIWCYMIYDTTYDMIYIYLLKLGFHPVAVVGKLVQK
jgi:hypothetical protein